MSQFLLSGATLQHIACMLQFNSMSDHRIESHAGHSLPLTMTADRCARTTGVTIKIGGERHTLELPQGESHPATRVGRFIQAIANGTLDTAASDLPLASA